MEIRSGKPKNPILSLDIDSYLESEPTAADVTALIAMIADEQEFPRSAVKAFLMSLREEAEKSLKICLVWDTCLIRFCSIQALQSARTMAIQFGHVVCAPQCVKIECGNHVPKGKRTDLIMSLPSLNQVFGMAVVDEDSVPADDTLVRILSTIMSSQYRVVMVTGDKMLSERMRTAGVEVLYVRPEYPDPGFMYLVGGNTIIRAPQVTFKPCIGPPDGSPKITLPKPLEALRGTGDVLTVSNPKGLLNHWVQLGQVAFTMVTKSEGREQMWDCNVVIDGFPIREISRSIEAKSACETRACQRAVEAIMGTKMLSVPPSFL
jgi:rRNA-processing protein FCF1